MFALLLPAGLCWCDLLAPLAAAPDEHLAAADSGCSCHHHADEQPAPADHEPACPQKSGGVQWKNAFVAPILIDHLNAERFDFLPVPEADFAWTPIQAQAASQPIYLLLLNLLI